MTANFVTTVCSRCEGVFKEPDIVTTRNPKYDKLEYTRKWTIFFRDNYRAAKKLAREP